MLSACDGAESALFQMLALCMSNFAFNRADHINGFRPYTSKLANGQQKYSCIVQMILDDVQNQGDELRAVLVIVPVFNVASECHQDQFRLLF